MHINRYVTKSLELHLFFSRIMKEHALFLQAGFTPANPSFPEKAEFFRKEFESVLCDAVKLSDGLIKKEVLCSGELTTQFTALAESQTQCLTGICIDQEITGCTQQLKPRDAQCGNLALLQSRIRRLNRRVLNLLDGLIGFKETVLKCVVQGELFTVNYPLLIEHILREARLYRRYVEVLEREGDLPDRMVQENECFWNQIMMEHAQFIRGLLDPSEKELFCTADDFAKDYCRLLEESRNMQHKALHAASLDKTLQFRAFKEAGTQGIQQCRIRSVILPLLADHVLREANHYLRLLQCGT